jgi:2-polyprenyl-6-methoxyphenol hydroxylase-like FAD-dependent oxidoreductase
VAPGAAPVYAGYLAWRGTFPAAELKRLAGGVWRANEFVTVGFAGGHLVGYLIPGDEVNWVVYARAPEGFAVDPDEPAGVPPGRMTEDLLAHLYRITGSRLPPYWAGAVRLSEPSRLLVQPIYDLEVPRYTGRRILLAGDAAAVARPHTGGGAVKALQDAAVLGSLWAPAESWSELLQRYDAARRPAGSALIAVGRRLGRAEVERTPDWDGLDRAGFDAWRREVLGEDGLGGRRM